MIHPVYHGVIWETINAGLVGLIFCKPFVFGNSCPQLWGCIGNIGVRNLVSVILWHGEHWKTWSLMLSCGVIQPNSSSSKHDPYCYFISIDWWWPTNSVILSFSVRLHNMFSIFHDICSHVFYTQTITNLSFCHKNYIHACFDI